MLRVLEEQFATRNEVPICFFIGCQRPATDKVAIAIDGCYLFESPVCKVHSERLRRAFERNESRH